MKKFLAAALCLSLSGFAIASDIGDRLRAYLPESVVADLVSKGSIQNSSYRVKGAAPKFAPSTLLGKEALSFWSSDEAPFFVETLSLYKKAENRQGPAGCDKNRISILLRSISRLQGVEYYSHSRKKMRTLYEKSFVVDGPVTRQQVADPTTGSADGLSLFALQKDLTFGEYVYSYKYRETDTSVAFFSSNIDPVSYTFFKVLDPEHLRVSLVIQDMGDYFLVYNLTRADFFAVPGLEDKINSSFTARADAIYSWFLKEYEKQ